MIKKAVFVLAMGICGFLGEISATQISNNFSFGGGTLFESTLSGGFMELGFSLNETKNLQVRNYFVFEGKGLPSIINSLGGGWLGDKITIGRTIETIYRTYTFFQASIGFWGNSSDNFSRSGLSYQVLGGGGVEWILNPYNSFFFEVGGGGYFSQFSLPFPLQGGFARLTSGFRFFL